MSKGWIGVDLDGTLAHYDKWQGVEHIGDAVPAMLDRVKAWISRGQRIKIFTARAADPLAVQYIKIWCEQNGLGGLEVTNVKDFSMIELWDDRCVQVEKNIGHPAEEQVSAMILKDLECEIKSARRKIETEDFISNAHLAEAAENE